MSKAKSKQYNQVFLESYSKEYPSIVKSRKGPHFAFCTVCQADIKISHGGVNDIKGHIKSKKHGDLVKCQESTSKIRSYFTSGDTSNEVIKAECLFTAFILEHNLPVAVADHAGPLFRKMFPKCETAQRYGSGRTKTGAIIGKMAAKKNNSLVNLLQNTLFSIATDGSNDSDSQLYPIIVTCFDPQLEEIVSSILAVPVLSGSSTGLNIGNLLLETLGARNIPIKNCIALGADNAPVMLGLKNGVAGVLKVQNEELIVMGCACHLIHLAAEKAANALPVHIAEVLVDVFYYLKRSAKRKEEFKEIQSAFNFEEHKILKHVCTRWLSLGKSLKRFLEQWDPLASFFKNQIKKSEKVSSSLETYRIPLKKTKKENNGELEKCQSLQIVSDKSKKRVVEREFKDERPAKAVKNCTVSKPSQCPLSREERILLFLSSDLNKVYCLFLDFIIPTFDSINLILQSEAPKIHILNSLLLDMFKNLISKFVKPDIIKNGNLMDINYSDVSNQKSNEDIIIGSAAFKIVKLLKEDDRVIFYSSIRKYYIACCHYIRHKFPINNDLLIHAEVANVDKLATKSFLDVDYFLNKFNIMFFQEECENEDEVRDELQSKFCNLQIDDLPNDVKSEERMDKKWAIIGKLTTADGKLKYRKLSSVMLSILTIPHSNAACERLFSSVKKNRTQFRNSLSNKGLEDILIGKGMKGHCFEQNFDKEFLKSAKSATYEHLNKTDTK